MNFNCSKVWNHYLNQGKVLIVFFQIIMPFLIFQESYYLKTLAVGIRTFIHTYVPFNSFLLIYLKN